MEKLTPEQLVEIYNPSNAKNLTEDQVRYMQQFTKEDLQVLAQAYPNQAKGNNYLVLYNNTVDPKKQPYQLSTYANLLNLWKYGKKEFSIFSFYALFKNNGPVRQPVKQEKAIAPKIVDLTKDDLKHAPGIKKDGATEELQSEKAPEVKEPADQSEEIDNAKKEPDQQESAELTEAKSALTTAQAELKELQDQKAHHMTIKSKQAEIDALVKKVEDLSR